MIQNQWAFKIYNNAKKCFYRTNQLLILVKFLKNSIKKD